MPKQPLEVADAVPPDDEADALDVVAETPPIAHTMDEQAEEQSLVESLLQDMAATQDPWAFLAEIETREIPLEQRHAFYQTFIALAALRDQAEQDALLSKGLSIFRYRIDTARTDVKKLRDAGATRVRIEPSVVAPDLLAEAVYVPTPKGQTIKYLVYHPETAVLDDPCDSVTVDGVVYVPPQSQLVERKTIVLPTGVEEYGEPYDLFLALVRYLKAFVFIENKDFETLAAVFILYTWVVDKFGITPYLRFQGSAGVGKSTAAIVATYAARRGVLAGGATTEAPIFRILDRFKGTFFMDEADFQNSDMWQGIMKVLNIGYTDKVSILRAERSKTDDFEVRPYFGFGPKILTTRRRFADEALESRCLSHTMTLLDLPHSSETHSRVPFFLGPDFEARAQTIRNQCLLWRFRAYHTLHVDPYRRIAGLDARMNQIVLPLLSVANAIGPTIEPVILRCVGASQQKMEEDKQESFEGRVAYIVLDRRRASGVDDEFVLREVIDHLKREFGEGKIEARSVSNIIRHTFGLSTRPKAGLTFVRLPKDVAQRLAKRYHHTWRQFERASDRPKDDSAQKGASA
jgi:hypothetical protein